jgi:two-component system sensor kinase FixL
VTEHKKSEQALRDSECRYRDLFKNANDALATVTLDGVLTSLNQATEILLGWYRDDMQGMPLHTYLTPSSATRMQEQHRRAIEREARSSSFELEFIRKDGSLVQVESRIQLIGDTTGAPIGLQAAYRDITERKQAEAERQALNAQLVETSRQAGMAEVATHVLHNVGNVLNSVNVSAGVLMGTVRQSRLSRVSQIGSMIQQHTEGVAHYFTQDPKGQQIPTYLTQLGETLVQEQTTTLKELEGLNQNLDHIKQIIGLQQDIAKVGGVQEILSLEEVVEQALQINIVSLDQQHIEVYREYATLPPLLMDRHAVMQIIVNLISNAKQAMQEAQREAQEDAQRETQGDADISYRLTIRIGQVTGKTDFAHVQVSDTGKGIKTEHLDQVFRQGFTTKKDGHGFGLHSGILSAQQMGGALSVDSQGEGKGATFILELPLKQVAQESGQEYGHAPLAA